MIVRRIELRFVSFEGIVEHIEKGDKSLDDRNNYY